MIINRFKHFGEELLTNDYFSGSHTYNNRMFWRRFQMSQPMFLRTVDAVVLQDDYFMQKRTGFSEWLGFIPIHEIAATMRNVVKGRARLGTKKAQALTLAPLPP